MSKSLTQLRKDYEKADTAAIRLSREFAEKEQKAIDALKAEYHDRIWEANRAAADAQKAYCDAEAAAALEGRDDAQETADRLGLTLPN